jgi:hypothetical protein
MKYDRSTPIAVFLGPSLDEASARAILAANYYPPVKMGDVYRLVSCGVRLIVIIDGVFHGTTPVWQREIVAAIDNGIKVVGASSMGALRAIELESFGMIGLGTIVDWYRSGRIEGDDEVALQHADGEYGYRALSEPLVNVRWNLERAAAAGVIGDDQRDALTAAMQAMDHTSRSYGGLWASEAGRSLPAATQDALRVFLKERSENLKARDAVDALQWCKARLAELTGTPTAARASYTPPVLERANELWLRGVPGPDGSLVTVREIAAKAAADRDRLLNVLNHASRRFYMLDWAARAGVTMPEGVAETFAGRFFAMHGLIDRTHWLMTQGMTEPELRRALHERAFVAWLLDVGPEGVGLDRPFLEAWARDMGIEPPPGLEESRVFRSWLVERTPAWFGFDRWSADIEFIRELQLAGEMGQRALALAEGVDARPA